MVQFQFHPRTAIAGHVFDFDNETLMLSAPEPTEHGF
jgi:hypothetical protein